MTSIAPDQIGDVIVEVLGVYKKDVEEAVDAAAEKAAKSLVEKTQATAPVGVHKRGSKRRRHYRKQITYKKLSTSRAVPRYLWHVKGPDYRLTHLLVHGHATNDGGRTRADPFLKNACDEVFPQFEADVEKAVQQK